MPDVPPLTDDQVHELLHECLLLLSDRTVATKSGQDVLTVALKQIEILQRTLLILNDRRTKETPE